MIVIFRNITEHYDALIEILQNVTGHYRKKGCFFATSQKVTPPPNALLLYALFDDVLKVMK